MAFGVGVSGASKGSAAGADVSGTAGASAEASGCSKGSAAGVGVTGASNGSEAG